MENNFASFYWEAQLGVWDRENGKSGRLEFHSCFELSRSCWSLTVFFIFFLTTCCSRTLRVWTFWEVQTLNSRGLGLKALANEDTLLRTHCCSWCFLGAQTRGTQNVSMVPKLGNICCGHKMFLNKIKGLGKRGLRHIAADTNVSPFAHNICFGHKKCFWFCSETFCVRNKCFPVWAAWKHSIHFVSHAFPRPRNIMSNNVSATMCPHLPGR